MIGDTQQLAEMTSRLKGKPTGNPPAITFGSIKKEHVGMLQVIMPEGSTSQVRGRETSHEYIGVITGSVTIYRQDDSKRVTLKQYDTAHIKPGEFYFLQADTDSLLWMLTVPPGEDYKTLTEEK